jgi:hypothetical protein
MGTTRRAFAVYSIQRRPDAEKLEVAEFAYRTENALFFAHGQYYVELIAAIPTEDMAEAMRSFTHNFVEKTGAHGEGIGELSLFPRERLDQDSIRLLASDAFYHAFLIANGGVDVESGMEIPGAKVVEILDTFEVFFNHGKFLVGIHGAEDRGQAERLAVRLMQKLPGADT